MADPTPVTNSVNKFNGIRMVKISYMQDNVRKSAIIIGNRVGADGIDAEADNIEQTLESYEGTESSPVGVELKPATLNFIPYDLSDLGNMVPGGYDADTNTWNMFAANCASSDATVAFEKVCANPDGTHGVNVLFRHAEISLAHEMNLKRATTMVLAVTLYPHFAPGSDYGLAGDNGTKDMAWQYYSGVYDGTTDTVKYDEVPTPPKA